MTQSANNKRIAKNTLFLYIRMALVLCVSLYTTRIVLRALGVVDYGIYNVVGGFVSMFAFLNGSMSNAIQRFYNFQLGRCGESSITAVYNTALQLQVIIALVLFVLLETVGVWYMYTQMVVPADRFITAMWIFQFSVISMLLTIIRVPYSAAIMAYERMEFYAYVSIFEVVAKLIVAYFLMMSDGDRLLLYGALNMGVSLVMFLLNACYCRYNFKYLAIKLRLYHDLFKPMLSFSGWNLLETFAYMIKGQGVNMLLNVFFGPIVNAANGISYMIMNAISGFQVNVVVAFRPQIIRSYSEGNYSHVEKLFYSLSKVSYVLLFILSIPVILEIDFILSLWLGDEIPDYTKSFAILVLINMIISSLNTPVSQVVHATGKIKRYDIATSLVVCGVLPLSWLFLKLGYSPNSVFVVSLIMTVVNQMVCNLCMKKVFTYSIREYLKTVILPCCLFSLFVPILPYFMTLFYSSSFMRLIMVGGTSILLSCIMAYFFIFNKAEKTIVKNFIRR